MAFIATLAIFCRWISRIFIPPKRSIAPEIVQAPKKLIPITPPAPEPTKLERFYAISKSFLGLHISLDETVPFPLGCADSLSYVLKKTQLGTVPSKGIAGTNALFAWLNDHGDLFEKTDAPQPGTIIISATGRGNGKVRGHCGVLGKTSIMSNNSETGKWDTRWELPKWKDYYETYGGIPTAFFNLK